MLASYRTAELLNGRPAVRGGGFQTNIGRHESFIWLTRRRRLCQLPLTFSIFNSRFPLGRFQMYFFNEFQRIFKRVGTVLKLTKV